MDNKKNNEVDDNKLFVKPIEDNTNNDVFNLKASKKEKKKLNFYDITVILLTVLIIILIGALIYQLNYYNTPKNMKCSNETIKQATVYGINLAVNNINAQLVQSANACKPITLNTTTKLITLSTRECFTTNKVR